MSTVNISAVIISAVIISAVNIRMARSTWTCRGSSFSPGGFGT